MTTNLQRILDKVDRWRELQSDVERLKDELKKIGQEIRCAFSAKTAIRMYADELRRCEAEIAELEESMK